jgi:hypothetical protein
MFPYLTLDESTLYYWTFSDIPPKRSAAIKKWSSAVPAHVKSESTLQGPKSTSSRTLVGGASRSSANSVLTDNIKVISHQSSDQVKIKVESRAADVISLSDSDGGLSDNDELHGKERESAINSPPKGKKRINSEVKIDFFN